MSSTVKLTTVGNSIGIVLPKEVLAILRLQKGDKLHITETPRGILLTPYEPNFAHKVEVARRVMRRNRDALRKLAE